MFVIFEPLFIDLLLCNEPVSWCCYYLPLGSTHGMWMHLIYSCNFLSSSVVDALSLSHEILDTAVRIQFIFPNVFNVSYLSHISLRDLLCSSFVPSVDLTEEGTLIPSQNCRFEKKKMVLGRNQRFSRSENNRTKHSSKDLLVQDF